MDLMKRIRTSSQPNYFLLDRFTFYESGPSRLVGFDEHEKNMVGWLSASGERFKAVGIYGMGGTGKTALVKHVLKHESVRDKFKHNIIWACLSDLTSRDEVDIRIVKYLLNYLGLDIDEGLEEDHDEDEGWLMAQLEDRLHKLGNFVIVLDDVWHCNQWLTNFYRKLAESKKTAGGALIVTSRIEKVAKDIIVGSERIIHLEPFNYDKSHKVFQDMLVKVDDAEETLRLIHGLPLAAALMLPSLKHEASTHVHGDSEGDK